MIYIEIMGGLGNQLFQIFTGISYAIDNKTAFKIKFNKADLVSPVDGISKRPTYWDNFLSSIRGFTYTERPMLPVFREREDFKYNKIPSVAEDFILFGYYQSYLYFDNNKDTIKKILNIDKSREIIKNENLNFFGDKHPISMHFRIGDYVKASHVHPILDIEYYKRALKILTEKIPNLSRDYFILYFFEPIDKDVVCEKIKLLQREYPDIEFRPCNENIEDYKQMLLMSSCSHNILANSTFSWWGAYFNNKPDKVVIYPEKWINTHNRLSDLFPEYWSNI